MDIRVAHRTDESSQGYDKGSSTGIPQATAERGRNTGDEGTDQQRERGVNCNLNAILAGDVGLRPHSGVGGLDALKHQISASIHPEDQSRVNEAINAALARGGRYHKAQARIVMANDQRILESGIAEQIEEEVRLPDGTAAVWLSTKTPLRNEAGEVVGLIGSSIDLTARKRAEGAVQELNATLEQKVQKAMDEREHAHEALRQSPSRSRNADPDEAILHGNSGTAHQSNR
jgi:hypothetical protein